jgi:hypothetical protein
LPVEGATLAPAIARHAGRIEDTGEREMKNMECTVEENLAACACTYPCERRGKCCACAAYHRNRREVPGCFFSKVGEKTYDRSIRKLLEDRG